MKKSIVAVLVLLVLSLLLMTQFNLFSEKDQEDAPSPNPRTWTEIIESDTLRVITIKTCYTAFQYKGKWYGYDYEQAAKLAKTLGLHLHLSYAKSEGAIADSLFAGVADLSIWPSSKSVFDTMAWLLPVGPRWEAQQVMVSARRLKPIAPDDTLTARYQLSMSKNSRQWLAFHDDSVRAYYDFTSYVIDTIPSDSLTTDQLADAIIEGRTDAVMLRTNVAKLMKDYYPTLKVSEPLPNTDDSVAWLITQGADTLAYYVDSICNQTEEPQYPVTWKRYYEQLRNNHKKRINYHLTDGALSPYDAIFRKYADEIGWDWRLLAAIGYIESKLDHTQISSRGPIGLMQLMPNTVKAMGYTEADVIDPDQNVKVATTLIARLLDTLRKKLPQVSERDLIQFTLAGYNAGLGHVYDAIYLADTLGYDTQVWENNVEHCLRLKSDPDYYSFPNVRLGRFNGAFTINYISEVLSTYDYFCERIPR